ncbi:MAG TPA: acyl-CoA dehydrogenase family protein [Frankiaceae bacterium]|jgi:alkylation response protein AidB-like acyl-CoA dehydrogenase|nr:acyl-CoA dehydrogenase family protein [Frankiaceae bacterium]
MDFAESAEHGMLRSAVAKVVADFGHEYFARQVKADGYTHELWQALGEAGFIGVNLPEQYGGGGQGIAELAIVTEETAAGGCPLLLLLVSAAICGEILKKYGSPEQQQRWLPALAAGTDRMVFAITEPDAGSNSHNISTHAQRDGDGWRLSGNKYYISGVDEASTMLVVARTGQDSRGRAELSLFVVDTDSPGLQRTRIPVEVGIPERQFQVYLDEVHVDGDRLVGGVGAGLRALFTGLNPERITGAAIANGIGRYALAKASRYGRERQVWSVPIGAHQGVAHPLATAAIELELARLMTSKAAWMHDEGLDAGEASNMAKFAAGEASLAALDSSIQAHGGNGMSSEYGLADMWGLVRLLRIAPVSREMVLNYVAQHTLGLPRSY